MKKTIIFDFDGLFVPGNTKKEFARYLFENAVDGWDIIEMGKLGYKGPRTAHHLNEFGRYADAGNMQNAEASILSAYNSYDKIINGVSEYQLLKFSEEYSGEFLKDGKEVLEALKKSGWNRYIVSGAIDRCVKRILEENEVHNLFEGIYCNTLKVNGNGIMRGLGKEIMTPFDKVARIMKEKLVDDTELTQGPEKEIIALPGTFPGAIKEKQYPNISTDITAVGHDIFDLGLLNAANLAIVLDTAKNPADSKVKEMVYKRRDNGRKTRVINNFYELPETLRQMEHLCK